LFAAAAVVAFLLFVAFVALTELVSVGAAESWSAGVHGKRHPEDARAIRRSPR